jgi:DNA-binding transcriptional ArsR family regulator
MGNKAAFAANLRGEEGGGRRIRQAASPMGVGGEKDLSGRDHGGPSFGPLLASATVKDPGAAEIAKALSHPLRIAILRTARDRRKVSPSEYARETGEPLGNVSYHVTMLAQAGVLKVVDTAKRRGALEHYYAVKGPRAGVVLEVMDMLEAA